MSCPACFTGTIHSGTPKGKVTKIHGLDCYISAPAPETPPTGIVIIIPDAFGWEFVNNRLLADNYAEKGGFLVYLPEFMDGYAAPVSAMSSMSGFFGGSWFWKPYYLIDMLRQMLPFSLNTKFPTTYPRVQKFFTDVRNNEGADLPIGVAGFCWGGKHAINLAFGETTAEGNPLIDVAFTGHPSRVEIPEEIKRIRVPTSFALGDEDVVIKKAQREVLVKSVQELGEDLAEVRIYEGACHGFCVRFDILLKDASKQAAEAEDQCVEWFQKHFEKSKR